jgi:acyl dehydratase
MHHPVRPGDHLHVEAWWTGLRRTRSKPDQGLATIRCRASNQNGDLVIEYGYRYLLACRGSTEAQTNQDAGS